MPDKPPARRRPNEGERQARHREKLIKEGGRYLSVELGSEASAALDHVRKRDGHESNRAAVEASLLLNHRHSTRGRRK
jgi:hypothetical protein